MLKQILFMVLLSFSSLSCAEEMAIALEKAPINLHDTASIKRGAKFFATICMSCHTLIYLRHNKLAKEAGITYEKMPINIKTWPLNVKPPDLTLETDYRGADWVFTYLHSFYSDPSRPFGVNNLLLPNTAMSGILVPLQGPQALIQDINKIQLKIGATYQWYDYLILQSPGSMSPAQFDATITDLVNFLVYAANPYQLQAHYLGYWVLGFLIIFLILVYLLKREYWRDVKK